jgi:hypothetical protein
LSAGRGYDTDYIAPGGLSAKKATRRL